MYKYTKKRGFPQKSSLYYYKTKRDYLDSWDLVPR